ncbi:MAG: GerW family sporulation protein [Clostridia bacterium]|jgi:sporulation protein YtfJ|nr:GerW family sporulation protein [Clostridia bacterium]MDD4146550.1 GerW family sporulation protein [Clostridia bacterium]
MSEHPIEGLMKTAMESIKEMVDVSTVVGDAVETPDGTVIIPISRVTCGFAAGGSEFCLCFRNKDEIQKSESPSLPFGGGSGAGVSVQPVGFLVVGNGQVRLMSVGGKNAFMERLIDTAPQVMEQLQKLVRGKEKQQTNTVTADTDVAFMDTDEDFK